MNFWRQTTHIMSYFKEENFRGDKRLPANFMEGFLEVSFFAKTSNDHYQNIVLTARERAGIRRWGHSVCPL